MLIAVIVACEIGFWVVLAAGLVARYGLARPRLGAALLIGVPLVDLVLLVATTLDLMDGGVASTAHGLAAVYLGFSVAFGHRTIKSVDARVAHRFGGGPAPERPPRTGRPRIAYEWELWRRAALAWAVACGLLGAAIALVGDADRTGSLTGWILRLSAVLLIWLLVGPLLAMLHERLRRGGDSSPADGGAATAFRSGRSAGGVP